MTIIRCLHDKEHPFVLVSRGVAQNQNLSYEALGLLTYLLSKPDDWKVEPETLMREGCGRNRVYKLLNELKNAGHIIQERGEAAHDKPPQWGERIVHEQPYTELKDMARNPSIPNTANPNTANAVYGENALTNTDQEQKQRQELNNKHAPAPARTRKAFEDVPKPDRLDIIKAWADNLPIAPVNVYNRDAYHEAAADIFREGYRAPQVALFVKAQMQEDFWLGKTLSLAKVGELMPRWLLDYANGSRKPAKPTTPAQPPATPYVSPGVDMNAIVAQLARDGDNDPSWTPQREASGAWKPQPKHAKTGSST